MDRAGARGGLRHRGQHRQCLEGNALDPAHGKLTDGPVAVGTRYRETRVVNGKEAQAELEVVRHEPPQRYSMSNVTEGMETTYHYTFSPERGGTQVRLVCEVRAGGLKKVMVPMVVAILNKEDGDHLARLKAVVEGS